MANLLDRTSRSPTTKRITDVDSFARRRNYRAARRVAVGRRSVPIFAQVEVIHSSIG
ncbi:hypothetical protein [Motilibacter peucedani]|uniref:hypothetical protein n=1 Tax=Motilibacter peucedani TaxID=598650 RepID=UPI0015FEF052|nr:hypothetical protein [Motilibacter peucedani]